MTTKPPTSLRIPEATRVRVEKWAGEQGMPRNAAYVQLIEQGLKANGPHVGLNERPLRPGPPKASIAPKPNAPAVHVDVPVYAPKAFNPQPKTGKK